MAGRCTVLLVLLSAWWAQARADTAAELIHRGDIALDHGRCEEAIRLWTQALELVPGSPTARVRIGIAHSKMNRLQEAERQFRAVIAQAPGCDEAWHNLGLLHFKQHRLDDAEEALWRSLDITRYYPQSNFHLGLIAELRGDLEAARRRYLAEVNANPRCLGAWDRLEALGDTKARRVRAWHVWIVAGAIALLAAAVAWVGRDRIWQRSGEWL